jgi:hypothetical protein
MTRIKSRKNNLRRKLSKKNNKLLGGGNENFETLITVITNPNKEKDGDYVMDGALALIKIEPILPNTTINSEQEGGAQVCSDFYNNALKPYEFYNYIITNKLTGNANKIAFTQSLGNLLQNVSTGPNGLDIDAAGIARNINVAIHTDDPTTGGAYLGSIYINLYEQHQSGALLGLRNTHLTAHQSQGDPNSNQGALHVIHNVGQVKTMRIVWRMCALSACNHPQSTIQALAANQAYDINTVPPVSVVPPIAPVNYIPYFINTDIRQTRTYNRNTGTWIINPAPSQFYQDLITRLRNYLLTGVNINIPPYNNHDQQLRQNVREVLVNTCSDDNDDKLILNKAAFDAFPNGIMKNNIARNYSNRNDGSVQGNRTKRSKYPYPIRNDSMNPPYKISDMNHPLSLASEKGQPLTPDISSTQI